MRSKAASLELTPYYASTVQNFPDDLHGSELVLAGYRWYEENNETSAPRMRAHNGRMLECLVIDALWKRGVLPLYYQAKLTHIPHVVYDILLYHPERPVVLSCKTSLRERWKQADLEALALKQVYRGATSVLVTLSAEGESVQRQIERTEVFGLDACVIVRPDDQAFDELLDKLGRRQFSEAKPVEPLQGKYIPGE